MRWFHALTLSRAQAWWTLALTVAFEVSATLLLKVSEGFTRPLPSAGSVVGFALTMVLLAKVLEVIPTSVAYTVWTGSGSAVVAVMGVVVFGQELGLRAVLGIVLVVAGVTVLNVAGATPAEPPV